MAVYQGARAGGLGRAFGPPAVDRPAGPRGSALPGTAALPRRTPRSATRLGRRRLPVGALLGAIIVVFVLAFFSLAQAVRVSASAYEVDRLTVQRERLQAQQRELEADLNRLGSEPAIRKLAFDAGLNQLDTPIILPVR